MAEQITPAFGKIGNALTSTAADHIVAVAEDLYDTNIQMYQSEINNSVIGANSIVPHQYFMTTSQYEELVENNSIIIDGQTIKYDPNAYYALYEPEE